MDREQFGEAIRLLEMCQAEGIATGEMGSLLDHARARQAGQRRLEEVRKDAAKAHALIAESAFSEAIRYLQDALRRNDDPALRQLLSQAEESRSAQEQQIEAVLAAAGKLVRSGRTADAVQLMENQPAAILRAGRVQAATELLRDDERQVLFRSAGRAYRLLESDLEAGNRRMQRILAASGNAPLSEQIADAFRLKLKSRADRRIEDVMHRCKALLRSRDRTGAGELAQTVSGIVAFASEPVSGDWRKLVANIARPGILGRFLS
jgi:hypothetical protein